MAFIKLHGKGIHEGEVIFANTEQIEYIITGYGGIRFPDGNIFWTKETPDEILKLIQGANNDSKN